MKTPRLVATMVLLATIFPLSTFATEPALSDDLETPDALIRGIISSDADEETQIQLGENLDVEQLTQDPLVDSTKLPRTVDTIKSEPDAGSSNIKPSVGSANSDKEASLPTLAQEEVPSENTVNQEKKIKEKKIKEKKPKKKWTSVFTRDTDEQRTDLETPDPLLDDF